MTRTGYTYLEVEALASRYADIEDVADRVFALLVDVADCYVSLLEQIASEHPAPFLAETTPTECAINGLLDHLEMLRDGSREQLR